MKKTHLIFFVIVLVIACAVPAISSAATTTLSSAHQTVLKGDVFNINITVNPQESSLYTAKIKINFPSDILTVSGFSFGDGNMQLPQKGYDSIDNVVGEIIKTAGFPGGITSPKLFGTVTFYAKNSGQATISIDGDKSLLLNDKNSNTFTASSDSNVSIVISQQLKSVTNNQATPKQESNKTVPNSVPIVSENKTSEPKPPTALLALAYVLAPFNALTLLVFTIIILVAALFLKDTIRNKEVSIKKIIKKVSNKNK